MAEVFRHDPHLELCWVARRSAGTHDETVLGTTIPIVGLDAHPVDALVDCDKSEVSGTARKIAETLEIGGQRITSLCLGGIVGHHEVIFGFPYQTVRLVHESIKREVFGTGAAFALSQLSTMTDGFYTFNDMLMRKVREQLITP